MTPEKDQETDHTVIAFEPDRTIRALIGRGVNLADVFTPEKIEACQKTIDDARDAFFDLVAEDLVKLQTLMQEPSASGEAAFDDIATHAINVNGHAELFDFTLIATISHHIAAICEPGAYAPAVRLQLINDLIKMLGHATRARIKDDHGGMDQELKAILRK
jgi:hypothetical protein